MSFVVVISRPRILICPGIEQELTSGGILSYISHIDTFRKIPKISPRAYIFQRPFLRGLYSEGLIYGGKFAFQNRLG